MSKLDKNISEQLERLESLLDKEEKRKSEDHEKICKFAVSKLKHDVAFFDTDLQLQTASDLLNSIKSSCIDSIDNFILEREWGEIKKMLVDNEFRDQIKTFYEYSERKPIDFETVRQNTNKFAHTIKKIFSY